VRSSWQRESLELIFEAKRSVKRWATYFARCLVKLPRMLRKIHRFPPFTSLLSKWPLRTSVSFNLNLGYSRTCFRRCKEPIPYRCAKSVSAYFVGYSTVFPVYFIQERTGDSNITPSLHFGRAAHHYLESINSGHLVPSHQKTLP